MANVRNPKAKTHFLMLNNNHVKETKTDITGYEWAEYCTKFVWCK